MTVAVRQILQATEFMKLKLITAFLMLLLGVVRNTAEYRDFAVPIADRFGVFLVAPLRGIGSA